MGRPHRNESPGYHHVVTRGNNRRDIYLDDLDRRLFCLRVDRLARRHGWRVLAYVLMRNHYHLLLGVGDQGLSSGMRNLNQGHAITFNVRHGRVNHLFGKRYWSRQLTTEAAVQNAARYIVQNPQRAGGKQPLGQYAWSSFAATVGAGFPSIGLAVDELLPFFGRSPSRALSTYREFCAELPRATELEETRPVPGTTN
ncbi:MAG: transposase [Gaiellaceae bacterium]